MNTGVPDMRIPKLAAECGLTEKYEDVKITDGYVDGEWYAHQGVQVIEWPALENCVTIDAEACNELRAVFHMLGEPMAVPRSTVLANMVAAIQREHVEEPKPWPFPTGKAPEKQPAPEPKSDWQERFLHYRLSDYRRGEFLREWQKAHEASATQPSEPQVRSRSETAKSPLNGLLTEQSGRYCGLGFCDEE
jgi:hypothetical protein